MLNLLYITIILVYGIDLSGFVDEISEGLGNRMYPKVKWSGGKIPKPFSCSLCATFWTGLVYLLITGTFSGFMLLYVSLLSFMTPVISALLLLLKDSIIVAINKLYDLIIK